MKNILFKVTKENGLVSELSMTLLRVFFGLAMAFGHGFKKLPPSDEFRMGIEVMGLPFPVFLAWCAALAEFVGGIFVAIGVLTRPSAFFIGVTMFVAAFIRHGADPFRAKELALFYLVVSILFVVRGAGRYSVDRIAST